MQKLDIVLCNKECISDAEIDLKEKSSILNFYISKNIVVLIAISVLLGRANILDGLAPFGVAFFAYLVSRENKYAYLGIGVLLGVFTKGLEMDLIKYSLAMVSSFAILAYSKNKLRYTTYYIAGIVAVNLFVSGLIATSITDLYIYDAFMIGFESIVAFVFVYILANAMPVLLQRTNRKVLSNEELICIAILISIVISGLSDLFVGPYQIKNICGILLTLVFAYNGGASVGASVGITIGMITSMSTIDAPYLVGIYGFCGLLAGIFKDLGKWASVVGVVLGNVILTFYISGATEILIQYEEMIVAFLAFLFMPKTITKYMEKFVGVQNINTEQSYTDRIKKLTVKRLDEYATAFSELSATYGNMAEKSKKLDQEEISRMVNEIAGKQCNECGMYRSCWNHNFYNMYNGVVDAVSILEEYGTLKSDQVPQILKKRCIRLDLLVQGIRDRFEIDKIDYQWQKKMFESRQLIAEQFQGISSIFNNLADEMDNTMHFLTEVEDALYIAFDKEGIAVKNITVLEKKDDKFEIEIERRACFDRNQCDEIMVPIVSKVIGRKVTRKNQYCKADQGTDTCTFTLVEAQKYRIATGISRVAKDNTWISGDNYSFIDLEDGKRMMAISDGMGSGEKAAKESMATMTVLEQLMEAGFENDLAIKTINSILVLKSSDEIFSTMDLSILDLYTGKIEFVKIGAAASFVKRANGKIEVIKSTTLPIGILNNVDIESFGYKLEDGDFAIMMSDGVSDAGIEEKENWVVDTLKEISSKNPQTIADALMKEAIERYGNKVADDMTVLVSKLWKS